MAFQYNIIRMVEEEKAEGRAKGLAEGRAKGRAEGLREGRTEGILKMISLLQKKYRKGKTAVEAAEDLEEDVSGIQGFYDLIALHPEEDAGSIYARYQTSR